MREAKYRAWHKDSKFMFEVNGMSPTAVEEKKRRNVFENPELLEGNENAGD